MSSTKQMASSASKQVSVAYAAFLTIAGVVYCVVAKLEFSAIQTVAGMSQCLAMVLLAMQVLLNRSIQGVSVDSLVLHTLAFMCRLSSTTWLNGYLPADASGDWIYQAFDVLSLILSFCLLRHFAVAQKVGQQSKVNIKVITLVLGSALTLACLLRANMDKRPLFDTLWMAGAFLASAATVLQLLSVQALTSRTTQLAGHALIATAMSHMLSAIYIWYARRDLTATHWIEGFNHSAWAVVIAHMIPVLLTCDFTQDLSGAA